MLGNGVNCQKREWKIKVPVERCKNDLRNINQRLRSSKWLQEEKLATRVLEILHWKLLHGFETTSRHSGKIWFLSTWYELHLKIFKHPVGGTPVFITGTFIYCFNFFGVLNFQINACSKMKIIKLLENLKIN